MNIEPVLETAEAAEPIDLPQYQLWARYVLAKAIKRNGGEFMLAEPESSALEMADFAVVLIRRNGSYYDAEAHKTEGDVARWNRNIYLK